jgi:hypothetical protein
MKITADNCENDEKNMGERELFNVRTGSSYKVQP